MTGTIQLCGGSYLTVVLRHVKKEVNIGSTRKSNGKESRTDDSIVSVRQ